MNVSSVKNLNGETFSAVQDATLTDVVQTNSGNWQDITAYQSNSASYLTAHQSLYGYATEDWVTGQGYITGVSIPESATWNDVSTTVQTNSAQWGQGGGAISSYTTYYSVDVPPFGDEVINSLNGMFISAFVSQSADNAKQSIEAESAKSANSANYAETVNETYLENKGFSRNLSSEYGTVSIVNNNIIESTNSAIVRTVNEGFVSSYSGQTLGPVGNGIATYSWDKSLPNTIIALNFPSIKNEILTYSANTNLTGEIALPADTPAGGYTQTINIPNATEFKVWANNWVYVYQVVVSAADQFETTVGELAWASALPTYEYDSTNKISAINGSALAGGGDVPSGTMNTSALEYNAVGEISGFGSSAIAQYGAEKQWLVHDDTIVHVANSAQYAFGCNVSALQRLMGIDETVLWSGSIYTTAQSAGLSDSVFNYNSVKFYYTPYKEPQRRLPQIRETVFDNTELTDSQPYLMHEMIYYMAGGSITGECFYSQISDNGSTLRLINGIRTVNFNAATTGITAFSSCLSKIVGIGRKA